METIKDLWNDLNCLSVVERRAFKLAFLFSTLYLIYSGTQLIISVW